jgi:hypothetical protein
MLRSRQRITHQLAAEAPSSDSGQSGDALERQYNMIERLREHPQLRRFIV